MTATVVYPHPFPPESTFLDAPSTSASSLHAARSPTSFMNDPSASSPFYFRPPPFVATWSSAPDAAAAATIAATTAPVWEQPQPPPASASNGLAFQTHALPSPSNNPPLAAFHQSRLSSAQSFGHPSFSQLFGTRRHSERPVGAPPPRLGSRRSCHALSPSSRSPWTAQAAAQRTAQHLRHHRSSPAWSHQPWASGQVAATVIEPDQKQWWLAPTSTVPPAALTIHADQAGRPPPTVEISTSTAAPSGRSVTDTAAAMAATSTNGLASAASAPQTKEQASELAQFAAQMIVYIWFSSGVVQPLAPSKSKQRYLRFGSASPPTSLASLYNAPLPLASESWSNSIDAAAAAAAAAGQSISVPTSPNGDDGSVLVVPTPAAGESAPFHPTPEFIRFMNDILSATQLSHSVVLLALLYVHRLKSRHPHIQGQPGSEFRLSITALMLANKFLDDHTYMAKTWQDVSGIELRDINRMETEFWNGIENNLYVSETMYMEWLGTLDGLSQARAQQLQRRERVRKLPTHFGFGLSHAPVDPLYAATAGPPVGRLAATPSPYGSPAIARANQQQPQLSLQPVAKVPFPLSPSPSIYGQYGLPQQPRCLPVPPSYPASPHTYDSQSRPSSAGTWSSTASMLASVKRAFGQLTTSDHPTGGDAQPPPNKRMAVIATDENGNVRPRTLSGGSTSVLGWRDRPQPRPAPRFFEATPQSAFAPSVSASASAFHRLAAFVGQSQSVVYQNRLQPPAPLFTAHAMHPVPQTLMAPYSANQIPPNPAEQQLHFRSLVAIKHREAQDHRLKQLESQSQYGMPSQGYAPAAVAGPPRFSHHSPQVVVSMAPIPSTSMIPFPSMPAYADAAQTHAPSMYALPPATSLAAEPVYPSVTAVSMPALSQLSLRNAPPPCQQLQVQPQTQAIECPHQHGHLYLSSSQPAGPYQSTAFANVGAPGVEQWQRAMLRYQ